MWRNNVYNSWCFAAFYNVLWLNQFFLQFTLFCREIGFGMIYALLRGEKFSKKLCPWRQNDKYEVWSYVHELVQADSKIKESFHFHSLPFLFSHL